jgi:DNA polymerase-3 subunit alpha
MAYVWNGSYFVELHNHTYYSALDGFSSPEEYCTRAHEIGIDTIAITDHGTLAGHRHFQRATTAAGIKPILGVEAYISQTDRFDKRSKATRQDGTEVYNHIILLAKNDAGVIDLNILSEIGWTEGFYKKPRIDFEALSEHGDNLIVLSGCMSGLIAKNILNDQ